MKKHLSKIHSVVLRKFHELNDSDVMKTWGRTANYFHAHRKSLVSRGTFALLVVLFFGMASTYILDHRALRGVYSAELSFADLSPKGVAGGKIFPASCEVGYSHFPDDCTPGPSPACSYVGELISDATPSGSRGAISGHNYFVGKFAPTYYCFGNSGGSTYYIPIGTQSEMDAFVGAFSRLSGLFTIKTCLEGENCAGTILACAYAAPDGSGVTTAPGTLATAAYGSWSNTQCGTSGLGWHAQISSCSTGAGTGFAKCKWILVR